jgi:hypothetical protein
MSPELLSRHLGSRTPDAVAIVRNGVRAYREGNEPTAKSLLSEMMRDTLDRLRRSITR